MAAAAHLGRLGLEVAVCDSVPAFIDRLEEGAGAALIAEEALKTELPALGAWASKQEPWSDLPFVVLTLGHHPKIDAQRVTLLQSLRNVTLLERPLSTVSMASTVKAALRARNRQYQTKAMLEDLRASEERLRLFIEHAPAALVMVDRQMRYLAVSRRWLKDFHLSESLVGKCHYDVFPEIPAEWREGHRRCLEGVTESPPASEFVRRDGSIFWLKREIRPWRDNQGHIGGLIIGWEDITASKQAEERQHMLMRELLHRTKNLLAVIQSIASGTFRSRDDPAHQAFQSRLHALATAHEQLTEAQGQSATLEEIARGQLASFAGDIAIAGPTVALKPSAAQSFALLIHELATNASKYGALSTPTGTVAVQWSIVRNGGSAKLRFGWREHGGPPVVKPDHKGFGALLLQHAMAGLNTAPIIEFRPEGLVYETLVELETIVPEGEVSVSFQV